MGNNITDPSSLLTAVGIFIILLAVIYTTYKLFSRKSHYNEEEKELSEQILAESMLQKPIDSFDPPSTLTTFQEK